MTTRDEIVARLDDLNDEQLAHLATYIDLVIDANRSAGAYHPEEDPLLNGEWSFEGPPDLATRSSEILRAEFGLPKDKRDNPR